MDKRKHFESPELTVTSITDAITTSGGESGSGGERDENEWDVLPARYCW